MDLTNRTSRTEIAEQLGVQTQTIADRQNGSGVALPSREGVHLRWVLDVRTEVHEAIEQRMARRRKRVLPSRN